MTINCRGKLIDLHQPKVMGILNVTPDSFYEGSRKKGAGLLKQAEKLLDEGATILDIGGYSSRPGANFVDEKEEIDRVIPAIEAVVSRFPEVVISVDTFRASLAKAAIQSGAAMVNDITGGQADEDMMPTVAALQVPYIIMHMRGTPQTMQNLTDYDDIVIDIRKYFSERISLSRKHGLNDIIIDLGFGFAKTIDQNYYLLRHLQQFKAINVPILTGISRKSMIYKTLGTTAEEALNGTTALHMMALQNGSNILRVHDVKEAMECIKLYKRYSKPAQ
jgi:dihydropteroate synthase